MKSIKSILNYSFLLILVASLWACTETNVGPAGNNNPPPPDNSAPAFNLTSVDGGQVSLASLAGKPVVIFFFGSSCPLCASSAPSIETEIQQKYDNTEITVIGIDTWDGNQQAVVNFRNNTGITFELLLMGSTVEKAYGTTYDRMVVIDADGDIVFKGNTSALNDVNKVVNVLEDLLM